MGFRRRQALTAALAANAIRPASGWHTSVPAFFPSWLAGELAPQLLGLTLADTAAHLTSHRRSGRDWLGLGLATASMAGLGYLIQQARATGDVAERALADGIGEYRERLGSRTEDPVTFRGVARPFRHPKHDVHVERDIAYNGNGRRGMLDIYSPADADLAKAPVLIQIHGGAWMISKKEEQALPLMHHLAARGWICVAINYRLSPKHAWPAHIVDVKEAIAWVRRHIASYGGDPDYLVLTGGSAGGHLTALAALTANDPAFQPGFEDEDTSVAAAVPIYGVYDFAGATDLPLSVKLRDAFLAPRVMQTTFEKDPDLFRAASPLLRIHEDAPDMFVVHGEKDTLARVEQARLFVERLRETSRATVTYLELPGAQHAFEVFNSLRSGHVIRAIERYLAWHRATWIENSKTPA